jgi:hypothetical protein
MNQHVQHMYEYRAAVGLSHFFGAVYQLHGPDCPIWSQKLASNRTFWTTHRIDNHSL